MSPTSDQLPNAPQQKPQIQLTDEFLKTCENYLEQLRLSHLKQTVRFKSPKIERKVKGLTKNTLTDEQGEKPTVIENKPSYQNYSVNFDHAMNGVDGFDSDKFHGLCEELKKNNTDFNLQIPQEDLNMMYASMISEFCMGDKAHLSWYNLRSHTPPKDFLEHMYVFDEDRDSFVKAMMPHTPRLVTDAYSWFGKKAYQLRDRVKGKQEENHAFGVFQIQIKLFTELIVKSPSLTNYAIKTIQTAVGIKDHPQAQELVQTLQGIGVPRSDDRIFNILHHPGMIEVMERLTRVTDLAEKVCYANVIRNKKLLASYLGLKNYNPHDMRLSACLAHLLGPSGVCDAILQQNIYLLAQALSIDLDEFKKEGGGVFGIDGLISLPKFDFESPDEALKGVAGTGGEFQTYKLFQLVKKKLDEHGITDLAVFQLASLMQSKHLGNAVAMSVMFEAVQDKLSKQGIHYTYQPLLSVSALQPLQRDGKIHLRYAYHYLKALEPQEPIA